MILLTGNCSRPKAERLYSQTPQPHQMGMILSPAAWRTPWSPYACDNDVFAHRGDDGWWTREGETAWLKMLDKIPASPRPLFVLLPDVVGNWPVTIERAWYYLPELRARNLPVGLALQDWRSVSEVVAAATMLFPDYWFVGGTTRWKWTNAEFLTSAAHSTFGTKIHIGRASGVNRIKECIRLGVDSCDGSQWQTHSRSCWDDLITTLRGVSPQLSLFGEALS